jgi:ribonuclease HI
VDAAVNQKEDRGWLGMVVRNADGAVLMAAARTSWPLVDVERAEIEAFKWATELVKENNWNHVLLEGDASNVVNALQKKLTRSLHNQVLVDNTFYMLSNVHSHSFSFCYREANQVAHRLARWATSSVCSRVWHDGGPSWITDIVMSDLSS